MLTQERKNILIGILNEDKARATEWGLLEPSLAAKEINKLGYDFTVEELKAFAEIIKDSDELDFEMLENIAGGSASMNANGVCIW